MSAAKHTPGLSDAQERALRKAASRAGGWLCPVHGVHAAAENALLAALARKGYSDGAPAPRITEAGRAAIAKAEGGAA